jgi:hypothetical protein
MDSKSFRAKKRLRTGTARLRIRPEKPPEIALAPIGTTILDSGPFAPVAIAMNPHTPEDAKRPICAQAFPPDAETWLAVISAAGLAPSTVDCYRRDLRDFGQALSSLFGQSARTEDIERIDQPGIDAVVRDWLAAGASVGTCSGGFRRCAVLRGTCHGRWRSTAPPSSPPSCRRCPVTTATLSTTKRSMNSRPSNRAKTGLERVTTPSSCSRRTRVYRRRR